MTIPSAAVAIAKFVDHEFALDGAHAAPEWETSPSMRFSADWQGKKSDLNLETEFQLLWTFSTLYLRFVCRYRELFLFADSDPSGRRDHLWDRDVAEAFFQPRPSAERYYKEFEIAPNGMWIDLDITPGGLTDLESGLHRSVHLDEDQKIWIAELAIPIKSICDNFTPGDPWRANFYRIEGNVEPRRYLAWQPTHTPEPNFHVPQAFGILQFSK
jgi:alpha-galactosidase